MSDGVKITHRELLTFSNLTNLKWEYANLEKRKKNILRDLLKPVVFYRNPEAEDRNNENNNKVKIIEKEGYQYGGYQLKEVWNEKYDSKKGFQEMRKQAGIAMEYLEMCQKAEKNGNRENEEEWNFINEWEVIYGGDKYKVIADYLDKKRQALCELIELMGVDEDDKEKYEKFKNKKLYHSRKFYENKKKNEERKDRIEKIIYSVQNGLHILSGINKVKLFSIKNKKCLEVYKGVITYVCKETGKKIIENHTYDQCVGLYILLVILSNPYELNEILKSLDSEKIAASLSDKDKRSREEDTIKILENINKAMNEFKGNKGNQIEIIEEIDIYDEARYNEEEDEFRVLVLKKESNIVISYKGKEFYEKKILPDEFNCLQMIYAKISIENPGCSIHFTGINGGGQLSTIHTLYAAAAEYYIVKGDETDSTLSHISLKLFGNSELWRDGIFTNENGKVLSDGDIIKKGDKIFYRGTKATIFSGHTVWLGDIISFTKEDINSTYEPMLNFVINIVGDALSEVAKDIIRQKICEAIGLLIIRSIKNFTKYIDMNYAFLISFCIVNSTIFPYLVKTIAYLKIISNFFASIAGYGAGVIIGIIILCILVNIMIKIKNDKEIKNLYNWLISNEYIKEENGKIKGYITDKYLYSEKVSVYAFNKQSGEEREIDIKLTDGLFIKYCIENHSRFSLIYEKEKGSYYFENEFLYPFSIKLEKGKDNIYVMSEYVIRDKPLSNKNIYSVEMLNGIEIIKEDIKKQQDSEIRKILINKCDRLNEKMLELEEELNKKIHGDLLSKKDDQKTNAELKKEELDVKKTIAELTKVELRDQIAKDDLEETKTRKKVIEDNFLMLNLEIFEKKYNDFLMMETTMGILGKMQRTIINKTEKIFEVIYLSNNTVNIYEGIPELQKSRTDRYLNEYTFFPFVKKDGYIDREKPVLREEYKISLIKTLLLLYKLDNSGKNLKNYLEAKYNPEILPEYQGEIFQGCLFLKNADFNKEFLNKIKYWKYPSLQYTDINPLNYNHIKLFFQEIEDNPKILENYYKRVDIKKYFEETEKEVDEELPKNLHRHAEVIRINYGVEKNPVIEYKYNPFDLISGGSLDLLIINNPEKVSAIKDTNEYRHMEEEGDLEETTINAKCDVNSNGIDESFLSGGMNNG